MSIEEIIERLDKMAQHHEICGQTFAPDFPREKYQAWGQTLREAIALLRTHPDAQPNEPLTLEELREMDGTPAWNDTLKKWVLVDLNLEYGERTVDANGKWRDLGDRYYRRQPKEDEK